MILELIIPLSGFDAEAAAVTTLLLVPADKDGLVATLVEAAAVTDPEITVTIDAPAAVKLASRLEASDASSVVVMAGREVAPEAGSVIVMVVVSVPLSELSTVVVELEEAVVELEDVLATSVALLSGRDRVEEFEGSDVAMSPPVTPVAEMIVIASACVMQETYCTVRDLNNGTKKTA